MVIRGMPRYFTESEEGEGKELKLTGLNLSVPGDFQNDELLLRFKDEGSLRDTGVHRRN